MDKRGKRNVDKEREVAKGAKRRRKGVVEAANPWWHSPSTGEGPTPQGTDLTWWGARGGWGEVAKTRGLPWWWHSPCVGEGPTCSHGCHGTPSVQEERRRGKARTERERKRWLATSPEMEQRKKEGRCVVREEVEW